MIWPHYSPQWFREDNNARNGSRKKKQRKAKTKMGEIHHIIRLVRWQLQAEWRRTGIIFAETSGQRRPDEDAHRRRIMICKPHMV